MTLPTLDFHFYLLFKSTFHDFLRRAPFIHEFLIRKKYEKRFVVLTFFVFLTFLRQLVTENSENFYEDQKFMNKGCSFQKIKKSIFK